jgi:hypothetical protein
VDVLPVFAGDTQIIDVYNSIHQHTKFIPNAMRHVIHVNQKQNCILLEYTLLLKENPFRYSAITIKNRNLLFTKMKTLTRKVEEDVMKQVKQEALQSCQETVQGNLISTTIFSTVEVLNLFLIVMILMKLYL